MTASQGAPRTARGIGQRALAAVAVLVVFVGPVALPSTYLSHRDIRRLHLPLRQFLAAELSSWRFPTWYPFDGLGSSFVGTAVAAPFSPLQLLVLVFPPDAALKLQVLLLLVLAAAGMARLVSGHGAPEPLRWAAAVSYAGSGYLLCCTDNFTFLHGAAVLPWVLDAVERLARSPSPRRAVWLGLWFVVGLAGGDVQSVYLQALLCAAWVLVVSRPRRPALLWLLVGGLVTGLLAAAIIPAIVVTALENGRVQGLGATEALDWSLHPARLLELPFGPLAPAGLIDETGPRIGNVLGGTTGAPWVTSEYLGVLPVTFGLLGLLSARRQGLARYAVLTVLALVLALGARGGLYPIFLRTVPLWSAFRYPEKLMPFALLGMVVLATRALQAGAGRATRRLLVTMSLVGLLLAASARPTVLSAALGGLPADIAAAVSANLRWNAILASLLLGAFAVVLWKRPGRAGWAAVAVVVVQGAFCAAGQIPVRARDELKRAPLLLRSIRASGGTEARLVSWPTRFAFAGERPPYKDAVQEGDWQALSPDLSSLFGLGNLYHYTPGTALGVEAACGRTPPCTSPCARRLGGRLCVVSFDEVPRLVSRGAQEIASIPRPKLSLLGDETARPWASVPGVRSLPDQESAKSVLRREGADLRAVAVALAVAETLPEPRAVLGWARPRPDEAEVTVDLANDNVLVLAENCARGWRAEVDGVAHPLERVDLALCGVRVQAGRHTVRLRYLPPGWPWGPWISLAGLGLAVALWRRSG